MLKPMIIQEKSNNPEVIQGFYHELKASGMDLSPTLCELLLNRNMNTVEKVNRFLKPELSTFYDPFLLKDMDVAVKAILKAIELKEMIMIYGDYDVDGVTSTTVLYKTLLACGANVNYYIPDRIDEGYGINKDALLIIKELGATLVISVDTGITAVDQVDYANEIGLKVIITDHHECQEEIPKALAVINPKQEDCKYPFNMLAGVGVTYKLCQGLTSQCGNHEELMLDLLEIVAVGTISDLVPLIDENRTFVYQAFKRMKTIKNIGLEALVKVSGIDTERLTAGSIGFQIGPRLNAAGRLGDAKRGVKLFLTKNEEEAIQLSEELNQENQKRRDMELEIFQEADALIKENVDLENTKVLVVANEGWHHGVIGIVASRITEKYYRPTILLAVEEGVASGSARSVDGFSIFDALSASKGLLTKFGGHEMAAGMSFDAENIPQLTKELNAYATKHMSDDTLIPKAKVEKRMFPKDVTIEFIQDLNKLEPYGMGNEEPKFLIQGIVDQLTLMGKERNHLKLALSNETQDESQKDINSWQVTNFQSDTIDSIGFYMEDTYDELMKSMKIQVIGTMNINEWKGFKKPQIFIKSIQYEDELKEFMEKLHHLYSQLFIHSKEEGNNKSKEIEDLVKYNLTKMKLESLKLSREDCVMVYKALKKLDANKQDQINIARLYELGDQKLSYQEAEVKYLCILKVFEQLDLIKFFHKNDGILLFEMNTSKKVELEKSTLYNNMYC